MNENNFQPDYQFKIMFTINQVYPQLTKHVPILDFKEFTNETNLTVILRVSFVQRTNVQGYDQIL